MSAIRAFARGDAVAVVTALTVFVLLLSWLATRRRPEHRPIAVLLSVWLAADAIAFGLWTALPAPLPGGPPLTGWVRAAFHVDEAINIAIMACYAATAWRVYLGRWPRWILLPYVIAVLVLAVTFPAIRGDSLARFYLGAEIVALALAFCGVLPWLRRLWHGEHATLTTVAMGCLLAARITSVLWGPYRYGILTHWTLAQEAHSISYAAVILLTAATLLGGKEPWIRGTKQ